MQFIPRNKIKRSVWAGKKIKLYAKQSKKKIKNNKKNPKKLCKNKSSLVFTPENTNQENKKIIKLLCCITLKIPLNESKQYNNELS